MNTLSPDLWPQPSLNFMTQQLSHFHFRGKRSGTPSRVQTAFPWLLKCLQPGSNTRSPPEYCSTSNTSITAIPVIPVLLQYWLQYVSVYYCSTGCSICTFDVDVERGGRGALAASRLVEQEADAVRVVLFELRQQQLSALTAVTPRRVDKQEGRTCRQEVTSH